jgi:hypothetical protein
MALTGVDGSVEQLWQEMRISNHHQHPSLGGKMRRLTAQQMSKVNGGKPCNDLNAAIIIMSIIEPVGAAILIGIWLSQGCQNQT